MKEYSIKFHDNRLVDTDGLNVEQTIDKILSLRNEKKCKK